MALFCVGNSHLEAVRQGAANLGVPLTAVRLNEMTAEGKLPASAGLWRALEDQVARQKPPRIVCLVGGGNPARIGLAQHPEPFDFVLPWRPDLALDPKAEPVPYDAVRALIEQRVKKHLKSLDRIRALGVPLIQLESPPPLFDNDAVLSFVIPSLRKDGKTEAELAKIGATFVSLQYGEAETEAGIAGIAQAGGPAILRDPEVDAFNDIDGLAAQIVALDAVLTISNTAAHLAGALGQRTAVLLDGRPHLVWPYLGDRTPWYRRLRLARPSPGRPALERGRDMVTRWIA